MDHYCTVRDSTDLTKFNRDKIVQITEALLSEPGEIRRFVQQAVDHWPHLLAIHFTLHSTRVNIDDY
ncbi:TPA: hypothetical protein J0746_002453 [Escherichia coli]|nr:hypothetical protein [Escherichia coli]HBB1301258.1 hypothetical protein [Escherichia coli]HBB1325655.1 hypothetical protein [Escherichia coli]